MHICVVRVSMFWHSQISILQLSSKTQIVWPIHQRCIQNLYTSNGTATQGENFEMDLIKEDQIKMPTPRFFYSSEEDFTPNHFLEKTNSHPSAFRLQPDPPIWTQNYICAFKYLITLISLNQGQLKIWTTNSLCSSGDESSISNVTI